MTGWENFLMAEVGASATLTGLILVGVSLNLNKILEHPALPGRAFQALFVLLSVVIVTTLLLLPNLTMTAIGIELLAAGVALWIAMIVLDVDNYRKTERQYRGSQLQSTVVGQLAMLSYVVGGVWVLLSGQAGCIGWRPPCCCLSSRPCSMRGCC
jgi:O-antigen/teichoic acid export membrane protein